MKIFIIIGDSGEYENHRSWNVVAYKDELIAKDTLDKLNYLVENLYVVKGTVQQVLEIDSLADINNTINGYRLEELELK